MSTSYSEKEKFRVVMRMKKLLQNLYSQLRNAAANFFFFYQAVDMVANCIRDRFQQKDYIETLQTMENLLLKALHDEDFGLQLQ